MRLLGGRTGSGPVGQVRKRGRLSPSTNVHAVAKLLPERLQSYEAWYFAPGGMPEGLRQYRRELFAFLAEFLGREPSDQYVSMVQNAAAGPVSDWYRVMLSREEAVS